MHNPDEFQRQFRSAVVGHSVDSIGFSYETSYSIRLSNGASFFLSTKSTLSRETSHYVSFETGFRARLIELLGTTIQQIDNREDEFELFFSDGTTLIISERYEDFDGPEGGTFRHNDLMIVFSGVD